MTFCNSYSADKILFPPLKKWNLSGPVYTKIAYRNVEYDQTCMFNHWKGRNVVELNLHTQPLIRDVL